MVKIFLFLLQLSLLFTCATTSFKNRAYEKNMYKTVEVEDDKSLKYKNYINEMYLLPDSFELFLKEKDYVNDINYGKRIINKSSKEYWGISNVQEIKGEFKKWLCSQYPITLDEDFPQTQVRIYCLGCIQEEESYRNLILLVENCETEDWNVLKQIFRLNFLDREILSIVKIGGVLIDYSFHWSGWTIYENNYYIYKSFSDDSDVGFTEEALNGMRKNNEYFEIPEYYCVYSIDKLGYIKNRSIK